MVFGIDDAVMLASAGGSILSALGGGKKKAAQPTSGFGSNPSEIRDYMLSALFPQIKARQDAPYQGIPRRRLDASDLDPLFGSKARQGMQAYYDYKNTAQPASNTGAPDADSLQALRDEIIGRMFLQNPTDKYGQPMASKYAWQLPDAGKLTPAQLKDIGKWMTLDPAARQKESMGNSSAYENYSKAILTGRTY